MKTMILQIKTKTIKSHKVTRCRQWNLSAGWESVRVLCWSAAVSHIDSCGMRRQMRWCVTTYQRVFSGNFQDLIYFAAEEHPVIDAVRVRRWRQDVSPTNVNNLLMASPFTFSHQFLLFPNTVPHVRRKCRQTYATPINFCFVFCKTHASLNMAAH